MIRTAQCCCGQASIELEGDPTIHAVCHCKDCKKRTGSAFGISAYFSNSQVRRKIGGVQIYEINNEETRQKRYFCSFCGTTLYWEMSHFPRIPGVTEMTGVASGCFVDEPLPNPVFSANNEDRCVWLELPTLKIV